MMKIELINCLEYLLIAVLMISFCIFTLVNNLHEEE